MAIFSRLAQLLYGHFPEAIVTDLAMIAGFSLLGVGFYHLCLPGRGPSLRGALAYVFRREFFRHQTSRVDLLHFVLTVGFWIPLVGALVTAFLGSTYTQIVVFTLVILALALKPDGLFGRAAVNKV